MDQQEISAAEAESGSSSSRGTAAKFGEKLVHALSNRLPIEADDLCRHQSLSKSTDDASSKPGLSGPCSCNDQYTSLCHALGFCLKHCRLVKG